VALKIEAHWHHPLALREDPGAIYLCRGLKSVPETPGVYVFGRVHGDKAKPLYIGRTTNLQKRLSQHLESSTRLMVKVRDAPKGVRFFMSCEIKPKRGHQLEKVLRTLEEALIAHALAEGHQLFNKQGVLRPNHTIEFTGNRTSESIAPRYMRVRAT